MIETIPSWKIQVTRGPDCLFIKLSCPDGQLGDCEHLAEQIWSVLDQHFIYRVVLEMDELPILPSALVGQLVLLHKRIATHNGMLRLCGLSPGNREALRLSRLEGRLPCYSTRSEAVMGYRPLHPR